MSDGECGEWWDDVPGHEGRYRVSSRGRVYNVRARRYVAGTITQGGYVQVGLRRPGERRKFFLTHSLVLMTFVGPRPENHVCDHLSGVKTDNRLSNLEYVTPRENARRAARMGLLRPNPRRGEDHPGAKLTKGQVAAIRERHESGESYAALAREYGVTASLVRLIVRRERWGHVPC